MISVQRTTGEKGYTIRKVCNETGRLMDFEIDVEIQSVISEGAKTFSATAMINNIVSQTSFSIQDVTSPEVLCLNLNNLLSQRSKPTDTIQINVKTTLWSPIRGKSAILTKHQYTRTTKLVSTNGGDDILLSSGATDLVLMKLNDSGFENFNVDNYTILQPARDRMMCSDVQIVWSYEGSTDGALRAVEYNLLFQSAIKIIIDGFFKEYSPSVQATVYQMLKEVLDGQVAIKNIHISAPNIHYIPYDFTKLGLPEDKNVLIATDEPRGLIKLCMDRQSQSV
eukprot:GHVH01008240.1.p1 GENE.GHVH01008240.1~~GHVH01008240.1.p1  ORF type:complete len:321 (+),score=38.10 GHVH01008240.1:123-965(+)